MAAPIGNKNATKNRPFADAIRRVLLENDGQKMRELAEKIVTMAGNGEIAALREVFDRIDGKVTQEVSGPDGGPIETRQVTDHDLARWLAFELTQKTIRKAKEPA